MAGDKKMAKSIDVVALGELLIDFTPLKSDEGKACYERNPGGAAAGNGIAIEINLSKFRDYSIAQIQQSNNIRLFQIAKRTGCKFSFGSDAHTMRHQQQFKNFYVVAGILNLTEDDLCDFVRG